MTHHSLSVVPTSLWFIFTIGIVILLFLDLFIFGKNHEVKVKGALLESSFWIGIALLFNLWFGFTYGRELGLEFLTAYLVEKSLSVDNLFVILLIFSSFKIKPLYHHRILFYGILGAVVFRAFFIVVGAKLLNSFSILFYFFGALLIYSSIKIVKEILNPEEEKTEVKENFATKLLSKFFKTTQSMESGTFFVRENKILKATPLFVALLSIEFADIVFAVDSIPAVFAVTKDGFVAFSSNILAILGLRALYFVLSDFASKLKYLRHGLAFILGFIGVKMIIVKFIHVDSLISLAVIILTLVFATLFSVLHKEK